MLVRVNLKPIVCAQSFYQLRFEKVKKGGTANSYRIASYMGINGFSTCNSLRMRDFMNCSKVVSLQFQKPFAIDGLLIVNVIFKTMILVENVKNVFCCLPSWPFFTLS